MALRYDHPERRVLGPAVGVACFHSNHNRGKVTWWPLFSSRWTSRHSGTGWRAASSAVAGGTWPPGPGRPCPRAGARTALLPRPAPGTHRRSSLPPPLLAAISLTLRPAAFSRKTSPIFLIGSLFPGTWPSPRVTGLELVKEAIVPASVDQGAGNPLRLRRGVRCQPEARPDWA